MTSLIMRLPWGYTNIQQIREAPTQDNRQRQTHQRKSDNPHKIRLTQPQPYGHPHQPTSSKRPRSVGPTIHLQWKRVREVLLRGNPPSTARIEVTSKALNQLTYDLNNEADIVHRIVAGPITQRQKLAAARRKRPRGGQLVNGNGTRIRGTHQITSGWSGNPQSSRP